MTATPALVSVVVIGRNEGQRLARCLDAIAAISQDGFRMETIYVDSDSSDGSPECAAAHGAKVMEVNPERPSAALGRNAGWRAAQGEYVLFLDGDTVLHPTFIATALAAMRDPRIAVVWGHRREMNPEQSLYVRALDLDWIYAPGQTPFCGGDALMRRSALEEVDGFDSTLIAGEEPELCRRIRAEGHIILHIDAPMTLHDLAITRFSAYWKRAFRAGHAYAEVAARHRGSDDPLWQAESRHNLARGLLLLAAAPLLLASLAIPWLLFPLLAGGMVLLGRTAWRCRWKDPNPLTCLIYAVHAQFQHIPIFFGQISQRLDARAGRRRALIDYKRTD